MSSVWSIEDLESKRTHLSMWTKNTLVPELRKRRRIIVRGDVKSGKRLIVQYAALYTQKKGVSHAFISAFHRVADDPQRDEMIAAGLKVFSGGRKVADPDCIAWIDAELAKGNRVVIHLDECDYGTGADQCLSDLWSKIRNMENITNILYSATPQEVLFSGECKAVADEFNDIDGDETLVLRYTPPPNYCGPNAFLSAGLVHEATEFFEVVEGVEKLTAQGFKIVCDLLESLKTNVRRNVILLRIAHKAKGDDDTMTPIHRFVKAIIAGNFPQLSGFLVYLDKGTKFGTVPPSAHSVDFVVRDIPWSNATFWNREVTKDAPVLIIYDQTCSRSTELADHRRIFATHDYREHVTYSTVAQAQQRVNHYIGDTYTEFQPIHVYGNVKTWQFAAEQITYKQFLADDWAMRVRRNPICDEYEVYHIASGDVVKNRLCKENATELLRKLGNGRTRLSARIGGKVIAENELRHEWVACPNDSSDFKGFIKTRFGDMQDPFAIARKDHLMADGTWQGKHGKHGWSVWTYETAITMTDPYPTVENKRTRRVICYKDGVLGLLLSHPTGKRIQTDSLKATNAMWKA